MRKAHRLDPIPRTNQLKFRPRDFLLGAVIGIIILIPLIFSIFPETSKNNTQTANNFVNPLVVNPITVTTTKSNTFPLSRLAPTVSPKATASATPAKKTPPPTQLVVTQEIPILMYHYVGYNPNPADHARDLLSITPDKFSAQMDYLQQNHYNTIDLNTLYGIFAHKTPRPRKPIILTFDDGYSDFYYIAYPILRSHDFHAVSFIITGFVGKPAYLTWDQIRDMNNSGYVEFDAHTVSHVDLSTLSYDQQLSELSASKKDLETQLGKHINFVAYPFGDSNGLTWQAAQAAGYVGGVGTWYGWATGPGLDMPRIRIVGTIPLGDFISKVNGDI